MEMVKNINSARKKEKNCPSSLLPFRLDDDVDVWCWPLENPEYALRTNKIKNKTYNLSSIIKCKINKPQSELNISIILLTCNRPWLTFTYSIVRYIQIGCTLGTDCRQTGLLDDRLQDVFIEKWRQGRISSRYFRIRICDGQIAGCQRPNYWAE